MKYQFSTRTFGKWILAGEHAVLRGSPALAFPLVSRSLELSYTPNSSGLEVEFAGENGQELKLLFYGVIENAMSRLSIAEHLSGRFLLNSTLPVGAGLGASAALCGAVSRWCEAQDWISTEEIYEFARQLENLFHGESSGVDLAVSLSGQGLRFERSGARTTLHNNWTPAFFLSYSGQRGMTSECVNKVKRLFESDPTRARALDAQMLSAVQVAQAALLLDADEGRPEMQRALELGRRCFEGWELCGGDLGRHMQRLEEAGALAVKPTGSGGGGYVLSLWQDRPPSSLKDQLLPCF